jgi:hypothetical protein
MSSLAPDAESIPGRPPEIRAEHLQKLAVIHVRQSSAEQVLHNTGSTAVLRALSDRARRWGWPVTRQSPTGRSRPKSARHRPPKSPREPKTFTPSGLRRRRALPTGRKRAVAFYEASAERVACAHDGFGVFQHPAKGTKHSVDSTRLDCRSADCSSASTPVPA